MTLKYSDDDITDEEIRELNLQEAAHQYMMQQDTQSQSNLPPFQQSQTTPQVPPATDDHYLPDGLNTKLSQIAQKQPAQLLDGSPCVLIPNPLFAGVLWHQIGFFVQNDTYKLYAIYVAIFAEIPIIMLNQGLLI